VVLRDPVTRKRIPWIKPVTTDEKGAFKFEKLPNKVNYLIEVVYMTKDNQPFRMLSLGRPAKSTDAARVSWRSMAVVTEMLNKANAAQGLYVADPAKLAAAEEKLQQAVQTLSAEVRRERMSKAIRVPTETLTAAAGAAPKLVVSDELSMTVVSAAKDVMEETAQQAPELKAELETAATTMTAAPSGDDVAVVSAATTVMTTAVAPTITANAVIVNTVVLASPSPSPSPTTLTVVNPTVINTVTASINPVLIVASPSPSPSPTPLTLATAPITVATIKPIAINPIVVASPSPSPSPSPTPLTIATIKPIIRFP
jgi:phosphoserine phosphatase